jgi:hypothetical protein
MPSPNDNAERQLAGLDEAVSPLEREVRRARRLEIRRQLLLIAPKSIGASSAAPTRKRASILSKAGETATVRRPTTVAPFYVRRAQLKGDVTGIAQAGRTSYRCTPVKSVAGDDLP